MGTHGEGGITRRKDGRLTARITMPSGRRLERTIPAMKDGKRQRQLAERALRELQDARAADLEPSTQTLEAYLRSWLRGLADARHARVRPRTLEFYTMIAEQHVIPTLGGIRLDRLGERHVQAWLDQEPGSARSVHHYRAVLRRALNVAVRQRILARNPAIAVELPEAPEFAGDPLTADEARSLLVATAGDRLAALWRLAIVSGLRQGELLGLAWDDVDLEAGTVTVTSQLARQADVDAKTGKAVSSWIRVPTKAARSLQVVSIDPATVGVLRAHQRRQAIERRPDWPYWGLVFVTVSGLPLSRAEVLRLFHDACGVAGIRRRRFHDLRGTSAHLLLELGVAEDVRMARLGHATRAMARHYAGASEALDRDAVTKLAEAIG
ncbi:MAG TPA: site-specific integrase [Candidatus Limnocylindrales bacterium]|nr:site-specific integrase [Candidatus Limnocylindrales bacterium]